MLTTTRRITADGLSDKAREWDALKSGSALSKTFRAFLAATMNAALAEAGQGGAVHVDQRPQRHPGPKKTNATRREQRQERQALKTDQTRLQQARHAAERAVLTARQASALERKLADLAERERHGIAAIEHDGRANAATPRVSGLRRLFQGVERQEQGPAHSEQRQAIDAKIATLKQALQAEHAAYVAGHAKEQQALAERQSAEDRQLGAAAIHRVAQDRLREQLERRPQGLDQEHEQTQERGHEPRAGP